MTKILLLFLLVTTQLVDGFKHGAPPNSCAVMLPSHAGAKPQLIPSTYRVSVTNLDRSDGCIKIRLYSIRPSDPFAGFLLKAHLMSAGADSSWRGVFTPANNDSAVLECGELLPQQVTHTDKEPKQSVDVYWQPPDNYNGDVKFEATFVRNYATYWIGIESYPIRVIRKSDDTGQLFNQTLLAMYEGCGSTKNCLAHPDDCIDSKTCNGLVSVVHVDNIYQVEMVARNAQYVAVGFSEDAPMGEDNVVECVYHDGEVRVHRSWNTGKQNQRLQEETGVVQQQGRYADGTVYCKLKLDAVTKVFNRTFDLNKGRYYLSLVAGKGLAAGLPGVGYHDVLSVASVGRFFFPMVSDPAEESLYDGCGNYKVCYGLPDDCVDYRNCRFVTMVAAEENKFVVSMLVKRAAYIATAFTEDQRRGNDHIVECLNNGSTVQTYRSWNVPYSFDNYRMGTTGLQLLNGTVTKDRLTCTVAFDPSAIPSFKLDQKYYLLVVAGSSLGYQQVGYHNMVKRINNETISLVKNGTDGHGLFYTGCGETRRCFGYPDGCAATKNCDVAVSIASDNVGNRFNFHMFALKAPAYVAVGLSEDRVMGSDAVIECVREEATVKTYMSWNQPGRKFNERVKQNFSTHLHGSFVDGKLECIVLFQNPVFELKGKKFDLTKDKYVLMLATGKTVSPPATLGPLAQGTLGFHDLLKIAAAEPEALTKTTAVQIPSKLLIHLHGSFMIISWIGLTSLVVVLPRYYKNIWSDTGIGSWFFWHKYSMIAVSVLTVIGVSFIYIDCGQVIVGSGPGSDHAFLGLITVVLVIAQPVLAIFRPSPGSFRRILFNRLHWLLGNVTHITAFVAIFLAVDLSKVQLPPSTRWILTGYVLHYVLVHVILTIRNDMNEVLVIGEPTKIGVTNSSTSLEKYSPFKKYLFKFHFWITMVFTVFLVYLMVCLTSLSPASFFRKLGNYLMLLPKKTFRLQVSLEKSFI